MIRATRILRALALGVLLVAAWTAGAQQGQQPQATGLDRAGSSDSFTLNLKNADITTLIATVSEVTGRNFVVDPRVQGNVTVLSNQPMTPAELYETFLSVLEVHGYSAVRSGEVTKIIPQIQAKQDGGFGRTSAPTSEDIITRVLHADNVPVSQLVPILRPLVPQYGHLAAYPASNSLIISDRDANVQRIANIVQRIDRQGVQSVERIHLQHATAAEVVDTLGKLKQGSDSQGGSSSEQGFNVVADERTNSVILSGSKHQRLRIRAIIADLDQESDDTGGAQVFYLNYADAEQMAPVLQAVATGQSYASGSTRDSQLDFSNDNSSGGGFGNSSGYDNGSGFGNSSSSGFGSGGSSIQRSSNSSSSGGGLSNTKNDEGISIVAESGTNALIVTAPPKKMRQIRKIIKQLDIRRGQVLVEAIIAEISLGRTRQLGVDIGALSNNGPAAASILDPSTLNAIPSLAMNGTPLSLIQQGLNVALGSVTGGSTNFALLVNALSSNTDTNVLSTPSLITRDNQEAQIRVGQEVPFQTGSYANSGGGFGNGGVGVNPFTTIERKQVGLSLGFIPQISAGETIQLTIDQEISSVVPNSQQTIGAVDLVTNNRSIKTAVEVKSGQILVLGGLIDNNVQTTRRQVPVLGSIPLLGALFRYTQVQKSKRNLLNFIRPTILRGDGEANYYTRKKYNYIRSLQESESNRRIPLMGGEKRPQLPPIEHYQGGTHSSASENSANNGAQSYDAEGSPLSPSSNENGANDGKRRGDQY